MLEDFQKAINSSRIHRMIVASFPNGEKLYIDESTGKVIRFTVNPYDTQPLKYGKGQLEVAQRRANMCDSGYSFEMFSQEDYDMFCHFHDSM